MRGEWRRCRRWLFALGVLLWVGSVQPASALELGTLLDRVRVTPPERVVFRELRYNSLLQEPMELSGYLEYLGPGKMRKVIESPFQEALLVDGDRIEISRDGRTRRLSLRTRKPALLMLQSIESLLAGNVESLNRHFETTLSGSEDDWRLQLTPKSEQLARRLSGISVCGSREAIDSFRFEMQNGEWQQMQVLHDSGPP